MAGLKAQSVYNKSKKAKCVLSKLLFCCALMQMDSFSLCFWYIPTLHVGRFPALEIKMQIYIYLIRSTILPANHANWHNNSVRVICNKIIKQL